MSDLSEWKKVLEKYRELDERLKQLEEEVPESE